MKDYISVEEFARQMSITPETVIGWCESGQLNAALLPFPVNTWRIPVLSARSFLQAHTVTAAPPPSPVPPSATVIRHFVADLLQRIIPGTTATTGDHKEDLLVPIDRPTVQRLVSSYYFDPENHSWYIQCKCWPAGTIAQARNLYNDNLDIDALLAEASVPADGWHRWGTLTLPHISFAQRPLVSHFATCNQKAPHEVMDVYMQRYLSYWKEHRDAIRQYDHAEGGGEFAALRACVNPIHPLTPRGEADLAKYFLNTQRKTANFVPKLYFGFSVDYDEAVDLDAQNQLVPRIRARFTRLMQTWGDRLL